MIYCCRKALRSYKMRASRAFPKEYMELIFGEHIDEDLHLTRFVRVPQVGTRWQVKYTLKQEDMEHLIEDIEEAHNLEYIGSLHSHTVEGELWDVPSYADNKSCGDWQEKVFAIDQLKKVGKRFVHVIQFWKPQQPETAVHYF